MSNPYQVQQSYAASLVPCTCRLSTVAHTFVLACRYVAEADPEEIEAEAPQLVPLTDTSAGVTDGPSAGTAKQTPAAASEGTPLLSDRAGEQAHQPVGDAGNAPHGEVREVSTLDGDDFVDLGSNAIITELEPER